MNLTKSKKKPSDGTKVAAGPSTPFVPVLPSVNLLPVEVIEVLALRALRRRFITAAVATAVVVGLLYGGQTALIAKANTELEKENANTVALTAQMRQLAPVKAFYAGVAANQQTITTTMAQEVLYSNVVRRLKATTPAGVSIGNVSLTAQAQSTGVGAVAASACPGPDPFNPGTSIGCVNVAGTATSRQAVGKLIENLFADDLFANPYVSATTVDETGKVTFTATVGLTDKAYSKRYSDPNFLKAATP